MTWIEWIRLQSADLNETTLHFLTGLSQAIRHAPELAAVEIYTHTVVANEIALLLRWKAGPPQPRGSTVGLQIAGELKKIGLVAHSVWICTPGH